ncbi:MAG: di-heme oxidoredictase family protein [Prevotella sp.]
MKTKIQLIISGMAVMMLAASCSDSDDTDSEYGQATTVIEADYIGKAVGNFEADEWYPGGKLGTTDNVTAGCYEDEAPAVTEQGLLTEFNLGETFFERNYNSGTAPFNGLGPASLRRSCIDCHPGYGHGKRQTSYKSTFGNGYLLAIYHPADGMNSNDGPYISEVTGMPQTQASYPFLPPLDEDQISISWHEITAMESGLPMEFEDGEKYSLIYPEVYIPTTAFNTKPQPENIAVRLESTIGIMGTGLLDAITEDDLREQYRQEAKYVELNPSMWDKEADDFASTAWYTLADGTKAVKRFTYALTRASLQDGAGANAIWNITNVTRSDRPKLYTTTAWADAMAETPSVIAAIKEDPTSPYFADGTDEGISDAVRNLLSPATNQFDNPWYKFEAEMSDYNFYAFLVWHRGLSIPRARNLQDAEVQQGKKVFNEIGCATCHRPSWKTGSDNYWAPAIVGNQPLPKYPNQVIYPYSDMIQHKLAMKNDIHGSWCRTTPLWGRGLSLVNTGAEDRLHDCRARNEIEAIMWHAYSKDSHAYESAEKFYHLKKSDRDAVVKFLRSI